MDTKLCTRCNTVKPRNDFSVSSKRPDGMQTYCKICQRQYNNHKYHTDPVRKLAIRTQNSENIKRNKEYVYSYLLSHPCVDCGESDPVVLEFDHIGDKSKDVSLMIGRAVSIKTLRAEIDKCEVRCANCHRRKTARQFGSYRYRE